MRFSSVDPSYPRFIRPIGGSGIAGADRDIIRARMAAGLCSVGFNPRYNVKANSMRNLPAPPGFQGLRDDLPLTFYEGALPHWRQEGATYFVTFRLGDSLPAAKLRELRAVKAEWKRRHPPPLSRQLLEAFAQETMERVDRWLDEGAGSCLLESPEISALLVDALHEHDMAQHELGCYVVMPNHVHAIVRPLNAKEFALEDILKHWKGRSAREINRLHSSEGTLWQRESFDRILRDEHLWRTIQYIGSNPVAAGLSDVETRFWIRPEWVAAGWRFDGPRQHAE